jgi:hypothetical protein
MTATNQQIMAEAWIRYRKANTATAVIGEHKPLDHFVIEVVRENWTPPEPVDPDVQSYRDWVGAFGLSSHEASYLAGARMAREREQERAAEMVGYLDADATRKGVEGDLAREVLAKYRGEA